MSPIDFVQLYGEHIPYSDSCAQFDFADLVMRLQIEVGRSKDLDRAVSSLARDIEDPHGLGPEFQVMLDQTRVRRSNDFVCDLFRNLKLGDAPFPFFLQDWCRKKIANILIAPNSPRRSKVVEILRNDPCRLGFFDVKEALVLWLELLGACRDNHHWWGYCPDLSQVPAVFKGDESGKILVEWVTRSKNWRGLLPALTEHPPLRRNLVRYFDEVFDSSNKIPVDICPEDNDGFKAVFDACLFEILSGLDTKVLEKLPKVFAGRNELVDSLNVLLRDSHHQEIFKDSLFFPENLLCILKGIDSAEANQWHWSWFLTLEKPRREWLADLPDRWEAFPLDAFIDLADEHPTLIAHFSRSKRLAALSTLDPDPLRRLLQRHPQELLYMPLRPRKDFFHTFSTHLDFGNVIGGLDDFLAEGDDKTSNPLGRIWIAGVIGTDKALTFIESEFTSLPLEEGEKRGSQVDLSLFFSECPQDWCWLKPLLAKHPETKTAFLERLLREPCRDTQQERFGLEVVDDGGLVDVAFRLFLRGYPLLRPSEWHRLLSRVMPGSCPAMLTSELAERHNAEKRDLLVRAIMQIELDKLISRGDFVAAGAYLTKKRELWEKVRLPIERLENVQGILDLQERLTHFRGQGHAVAIYGLSENDVLASLKDEVAGCSRDLKSGLFDYNHIPNSPSPLFSALYATDRKSHLYPICELYQKRVAAIGGGDDGLVAQLLLAAKERIIEKMERHIPPEELTAVMKALADDYPSRTRLEDVLVSVAGWPPQEEGNETFVLLDRLDDEILPGILRVSLKALVSSMVNLWDADSELSRLMERIYPDFPQAWARAITKTLDHHESLNKEWVRSLAVCLSFLREPLGSKIPKQLRMLAAHPRYAEQKEDIERQAAQFNRENYKKGQYRAPERRVRDAKKYLAKTSHMIN